MTPLSFDDLPADVRDASSSRLVVMIYDDAIAALDTAAQAAIDGAIEDRFNAVSTADQLVLELQTSLDTEHGGEIAANLEQLYGFVRSQLPLINLKNDPQPARNAIGVLKPLRDAWAKLDARVAAGEVPGFSPSPTLSALVTKRADAGAGQPA